MDSVTKVYFAGALFKAGDLAGNLLLAKALERVSGGRLSCVLPQDFEVRDASAQAIRDADLKLLLDADCAVFNFDGLELDSGTLAEFLFAKALDMPSVLFRSDFRGGGDQGPSGEPWNLMCSFHPRTETLLFDSLAAWKRLRASGAEDISEALAATAAKPLLESLRKALASAPLEKGGRDGARRIVSWAVRSRGASFEALCAADASFPDALLERKLSRSLL
jgi:hypothetical protein